MLSEGFALQRFVDAQEAGHVYDRAVREIRGGRKRSHWMWYVFPQIAGLGHSPTAQHFAVSGLAEAQAYLAHPVLGPRLLECARIMTERAGANPVEIFGTVDPQKLQSSMTLFAAADPSAQVLRDVLDQYFAGETDDNTTSRL